MKATCWLLCYLFFPLQFIFAQQTTTSGMPTVEVDFFSQLEKRLMDSVVAQDLSALDSLLTQDFELRAASRRGEVTLRDEWLQDATTKYKVRSYRINGLAVRQVDSAAIVNFFCEQQATLAGKNLSGQFFLVDVWQKAGKDWRLQARYSSGPEITRRPSSSPKTKE